MTRMEGRIKAGINHQESGIREQKSGGQWLPLPSDSCLLFPDSRFPILFIPALIRVIRVPLLELSAPTPRP